MLFSFNKLKYLWCFIFSSLFFLLFPPLLQKLNNFSFDSSLLCSSCPEWDLDNCKLYTFSFPLTPSADEMAAMLTHKSGKRLFPSTVECAPQTGERDESICYLHPTLTQAHRVNFTFRAITKWSESQQQQRDAMMMEKGYDVNSL